MQPRQITGDRDGEPDAQYADPKMRAGLLISAKLAALKAGLGVL
jgi:hypothetical protein